MKANMSICQRKYSSKMAKAESESKAGESNGIIRNM
jgi:hypothetical protein